MNQEENVKVDPIDEAPEVNTSSEEVPTPEEIVENPEPKISIEEPVLSTPPSVVISLPTELTSNLFSKSIPGIPILEILREGRRIGIARISREYPEEKILSIYEQVPYFTLEGCQTSLELIYSIFTKKEKEGWITVVYPYGNSNPSRPTLSLEEYVTRVKNGDPNINVEASCYHNRIDL